ncbi:L,D-transpeptidase family protein [Gryllotalpicola koreensis]|uniref:L,D-TPase catalytic domain-containing protein n=1 Tax=Gryllotalpicola koreensis TaxID=993086 RepID=A0ABP8A700_9MICO
MTDKATTAGLVLDDGPAPTAVLDPAPGGAPQPTWVETEREPRKKHLGLWLGIPGAVVVAAAVVASLVLIAPGVTVSGAPVGFITAGNAQQAITDRLDSAQIHVGSATLTAKQLGATIDAKKLASQAFGDHPLWKVTAWNPKAVEGTVTIDPDVALPALRRAAPELFTPATQAGVVFDAASGKFTTTPSKPGRGVDVNALAKSISAALASDSSTASALAGGQGVAASSGVSITVEPKQTTVDAAATTAKAQAFADKLNQQADSAGFYLQDQLAEAVPLATVASWMTVKADPTTGDFTVTPNQSAIDSVVAGLPAKINKQAQNETDVINSAGKVLRVVQKGQDGFGLASTDGVATQIASSIKGGDLKIALQGQVVKYTTTTSFRRIEVDKSAGATYLYEGPKSGQEKLVATYPIAIGTGGVHETRDGHFTIYAQLPIQNMGNCDGTAPQYDYCTKNVPWISYFDGDQGFHGTYWHNDFGPGARKSHGCVNMRIPDALALYKFAQVGTEVWVHD